MDYIENIFIQCYNANIKIIKNTKEQFKMNKHNVLLALVFLFGGIIIGFLIAPIKKGISIGNNSGNNNGNNYPIKKSE
ncbi:MAG: hypothetical protein A2Y17_09410 [Clostridiales bacterium GWF2_38_85]|nr:MAG: hypothetical protein A2Y17_09410 [Clostridiales bacterium GWF2_38_85]HBL83585.1 hypothetical protein [Clostridiales bacterium]